MRFLFGSRRVGINIFEMLDNSKMKINEKKLNIKDYESIKNGLQKVKESLIKSNNLTFFFEKELNSQLAACNRIIYNDILSKYKEIFLQMEIKKTPTETIEIAMNLIELYNNLNIPEMLKLAHMLLDRAADHALEVGDEESVSKIRSFQLTKLPAPDFSLALKTSSQWISQPGVYLDKYDSALIKQGCFHISTIEYMGQQIDRLDFKLTYPERDQLQKRLTMLENLQLEPKQGFPIDFELKKDISYTYISKLKKDTVIKLGRVTEINFNGLGKVKIGSNTSNGSLYNRITVEIDSKYSDDKGKMKAMYTMLTSLGLGQVFHSSLDEDENRKKTMLIFRTFFPREAYVIENRIPGIPYF